MPARTASKNKNPFLALLALVQQKINPRLAELLTQSEADATQHGEEVGKMVAAVSSLCLRGGKRLRPALCALGARSEDPRAPLSSAIEAGVALELLQAYFLIHDDWMDKDDERRGGPTAHVQLAAEFGSQELGNSSAILAGDYALALATRHLASVPTTPSRLKKCLIHFAQMQLAAVAGQQLDIIGTTPDPELTYALKTASYTVKGPLLVGAELAGASLATKKVLEAFSLPAGVAFQLRDDLLGVFGSSSATGKPQGSDLREGKNTSLVLEARSRLDKRGSERLSRVLGNRQATRRQVQSAVVAMENCGARSSIEDRIDFLAAEATEIVASSSLPAKSRSLLCGAMSALASRST